MTWRGLVIIDLPLEEEIMAAELAAKVDLDFDDGLHYYYAKRMGLKIVSFDGDFDRTDIGRLEPKDVKTT
ncbi:MAG: PIN domain-containing protein [Vulcanisaeta sp.]|uniref:PIN domain-containing protein n=1 Tax=Vulcanisaeta sp. TaxID=2020871 RepID=UPI003D0DD47B